jgi:hypothetical protein
LRRDHADLRSGGGGSRKVYGAYMAAQAVLGVVL